MAANLSENTRRYIMAFLLLILPWVVIILGMYFNIQNVWYFLLSITWFGSGVIFFNALT